MSLRNTCRVSNRHVTTVSSLGGRRTLSLHSRLLNEGGNSILAPATKSKAISSPAHPRWYSSSTIGTHIPATPEETIEAAPSRVPSESEVAKRIAPGRIRLAEHALYNLFSSQTPESSTSDRPTPNVSEIWKILSQIIEEQHEPLLSSSASSSCSLDTHQLRKLAPYALPLARILDSSLREGKTGTTPPAYVTELARWCFLSSILFGAPPIPAKPPTLTSDNLRSTSAPLELTNAVSEAGIRDIPQYRWPAKSTRNAAHVFSLSKSEQADDLELCQRPYLRMMQSALRSSPDARAEDIGSSANALKDIDATLTALETGARALSAGVKSGGRGQSLQNMAIHGRAVEPVINLCAMWLEANLSRFRTVEDNVIHSVSDGVATVPRILNRLSMQDLAERLQGRLQTGAEKPDNQLPNETEAEVALFLGGCLLRRVPNLIFRLNSVTKLKQTSELLTLWKFCAPILRRQGDSETRTEVLSSFLTTFVANITNTDQEADKLKGTLAEIYDLLPRPTPLPVYHALLSLYAGIITSSSAGSQESGHTTVSSEASLANLISTWSRMREEKVIPDIKAYMLLITGLGKKGDYRALQQAWEELNRDAGCKTLWQKEADSSATYPPMRIFNHFISTLFNLPAATGSATLALSLFDYLCDPKSPYEPDLFTVNIVLRHYARKGDLQAMTNLMDRLPSLRLAPDLVTYTTLISGLLDAGKPNAAKGILDVMQKANIVPNTIVYSLLIADLAKKGTSDAMASAETMIRQMNQVGLKPTAVTWTALASGYFRANMVKPGLEVLKRARSKGVELTRVSYNMIFRSILYAESVPAAEVEHILRGQSRHGDRSLGNATDTEAALSLLRTMIDRRVEPDSDTWFIILDSLAKQDKWLEGDSVIRLMDSRKFSVKEGSSLARVVQQIRHRERTRRR